MILISDDERGDGVQVTVSDVRISPPKGLHSLHICTAKVFVVKCPNLWNEEERNWSNMRISSCLKIMEASNLSRIGDGHRTL